tara:strand:- start:1222 stop:1617 length:396 start_codon:yes stop_codon:yes gene_type:complete
MKNILAKLFGNAGAGVAGKIGNLVDKFVHTKDEKAKFEKEMNQIWIDAESDMQKNVTERWKADLEHGNNLTKSVRPIVLLFLIVSTIILVFIDSGSINFKVDEKWTDLLQLILMTTIGAYFGGRSIEKIKK